MSKFFYRDIKIVKFCKICQVVYHPARYSFFAELGLCYVHRKIYYTKWYVNSFLPWFKKQTPEAQKKYRDMKYNFWKKWVEKNLNRRRVQALKSYHLNKDKHRARKHRRTAKV